MAETNHAGASASDAPRSVPKCRFADCCSGKNISADATTRPSRPNAVTGDRTYVRNSGSDTVNEDVGTAVMERLGFRSGAARSQGSVVERRRRSPVFGKRSVEIVKVRNAVANACE